jgi:hypothetical protein
MLAKINRFFFKSQYSIFDILWLSIMGILVADYSYWWFLLIIPFSVASAVMAAFVEVKDERE